MPDSLSTLSDIRKGIVTLIELKVLLAVESDVDAVSYISRTVGKVPYLMVIGCALG